MATLVPLPLSIEQLLRAEGVESARLEFKAGWNDKIAESVVPTICAFANDLQGLGGGYVVLGVEEDPAHKGAALLPPTGLGAADLDKIQQKIRVACKSWIDPDYQPIIAPRDDGGRPLLVIYAPAGDTRPYSAKEGKGTDRKYWVRIGSETIEAEHELGRQLQALTARVSFDDRRRLDVPLDVVSPVLLRQYFLDREGTLDEGDRPLDVAATLRGMRLTAGTNGGESPRNAALLFFTESPERFFPGAKIEIAHLDEDNVLLDERSFQGPLPAQIRSVVGYIESLTASVVEKNARDLQAQRFVTWPVLALREAVVNAVLHRGYDSGAVQPTRVKLFPDRVEITSYPGPVPGLRREHLSPGASPPGLAPRNPRVGELLKAVRLAETWQTGIPKMRREMARSGSGAPIFDFDDERTYFRVTLPAHPEYVALYTIQHAALLWVKGERRVALERLVAAAQAQPGSTALALTAVGYAAELGDLEVGRAVYASYRSTVGARVDSRVIARWARALVEAEAEAEAKVVLRDMQRGTDVDEVVQQAVLLKRAGDLERAHVFFRSVEGDIHDDPRALSEFAGVKRALAGTLRRRDQSGARKALNAESERVLRRIIELRGSTPTQKGWAWLNLARVLRFMQATPAEVATAVASARAYAAGDPRLAEAIDQFGAPR